MKTLNALLLAGTLLMSVPEGEPNLSVRYKCGMFDPYIIINTYVMPVDDVVVVYSDGSKRPFAVVKDKKTYLDINPVDGVVDKVVLEEPSLDDLCIVNPNNGDL